MSGPRIEFDVLLDKERLEEDPTLAQFFEKVAMDMLFRNSAGKHTGTPIGIPQSVEVTPSIEERDDHDEDAMRYEVRTYANSAVGRTCIGKEVFRQCELYEDEAGTVSAIAFVSEDTGAIYHGDIRPLQPQLDALKDAVVRDQNRVNPN